MKKTRIGLLLLLAIFMTSPINSDACTRSLYKAGDGRFLTSRSMDWQTDLHSNLWVFPRGMKKDGGIDSKSIKWTSKYGSLTASAFRASTADGMNEKGLVINLLYLAEADYGKSNKPTLSAGAWGQYVLDNYATVAEAVAGLRKAPFQIIAPLLPGDIAAGIHLSISDSQGDSAIVEYIGGKLIIHHSKKYLVMTNSPSFDQQLSLNAYWQELGGLTMLPGTNRASDRFARASYYTISSPPFKDERMAVGAAFSIIRNVSVPLGFRDAKKPNIATTLWRSVSDQKSLKYYFESTTSPNIFWVDLHKLDLSTTAQTKKLDLSNRPIFAGEVSAKFVPATPFKWLAPSK
ncbi:linear amide C-N hydrolase [Desulfotalea psychrophila]|uniref:Probable hydrolase, related to penicillin acylase n=1 Tax=Desulfotalea psychrophila (strain LSv54 / DSM 12343) TaxID=177439 RepID=Q6ARU1_DESPS|nr:linear amide C-N hydrolase [Desulfotalea psychrophila]CAG34934.1 probable hydrolase, related to penicillin acylase [Desulfotalea psychrophila LSv54]